MSESAQKNSPVSQIRQAIDSRPMGVQQYLIAAICFLINFVDGYDVVAISMAAPHIAESWQISAKLLGVVLSAELFGMLVGTIGLSWVSDQYGRRKILVGAVAVIAVATLATAYVSNVTQLLIARVVTGFGIGGILTSAAALAAEFSPAKFRHSVVVAVTTGFTCGAVTAGPIAAHFLVDGDWQAIFIAGGLFGLALWFLVVLFIPESLEFLANQKSDVNERLKQINRTLVRLKFTTLDSLADASGDSSAAKTNVLNLLGQTYRAHTLRLWVIFFLFFWVNYLLSKWLPKLFVNQGYDIQEGVYALTVFIIGGIVGSVLVAVFAARFRITQVVTYFALFSGLLLLIYSVARPESLTALYVLLFFANFGINGSITAMYAIATGSYPTQMRASGLGWCLGIGRMGAIASPIAAGYLVGAGWSMFGLYLFLAVPIVVLAALLTRGVRSEFKSA
ncbi:MAG: MFS transporter [bacterium]